MLEKGENKKGHRRNSRRARGEGTVYQRQSDKRWVASIPLENGKRKEYYFKTQREAIAKKNELLYDKKMGRLATGPQQTVKQFLEYWLEEVHRLNISLNTYQIYRNLLDHHILPKIGDIRLQKLTAEHIQSLYAYEQKRGLAVETVRTIHRMLHRALRDAVNWERVSYNVCDRVKPPRAVKYEPRLLGKEQALCLLEAARGTWLEAVLTLAVTTGMRQGEILGLKWQDIDFQEGSLQIQRSISRIGRFGLVEHGTKTEKSKRKIFLPDFVLEILMQYKGLQAEQKTKAGDAWKEQDIVFSNNKGGFTEPFTLIRRFKQLLKKAELPDIRFHDLRHSAATILLEMGVHPKLVQELLGHSNISQTMDRYSHVLPSMQREMMRQLDQFFKQS